MAGERHPISFSSFLFSCRWPPSVASAGLPRKAARRPRRASPRGFGRFSSHPQPTRKQVMPSARRRVTPRRATMASALRPCPFPRRPRQSRPCRRAPHRLVLRRLVLRRGTKPYLHTCPGSGAELAAGDVGGEMGGRNEGARQCWLLPLTGLLLVRACCGRANAPRTRHALRKKIRVSVR